MEGLQIQNLQEKEEIKKMEGTSSSSINPHCADDFYFSALHDEDEIFPISDEKYAIELQLQEALMSSSAIYSSVKDEALTISAADYTEPLKASVKTEKKETGESSQSFCFCTICMEEKSTDGMFKNNKNCSHSFCEDCISNYIAAKIQKKIIRIECPDLNCKGVLEPEFCQSIVPKQVFDRWGDALCESLVLESQKFYCPYKDCSAMLVDDGGVAVTVSECPICRRLFCAQCKVSWHAGLECGEFQALRMDERGTEDLLVIELAKNEKWMRCPGCTFYVEKTEGCLHIACRCGFEFCYRCGSAWNSSHGC